MNLQDIEAFVALAETGSVNRAAIRLNLTQPATTRRIQNFEAAIGGEALFDRSVKPAMLTAQGGHVLEGCRRVLAAVAELEASASGAANPSGDLKIGVAHGLSDHDLATPFDAVRRHFPKIRLQISGRWTSALIEDMRRGALDGAFGVLTESHVIPSGIERIALGSDQVVVVAAKEGLTHIGAGPVRLRDLADEAWHLNPPGCGWRATLERAFDRHRLSARIAAEVFGEELQMSLIARSAGVGLVARRQFDRSPHRDRLRVLDVPEFNLPVTLALLRGAARGRFDPVFDQLAEAMKSQVRRLSTEAL